ILQGSSGEQVAYRSRPGLICVNWWPEIRASSQAGSRNRQGAPDMQTIQWIIATAPEIFLLLAIAIGNIIGRQKFFVFSIGTTASILVVSVILGQFGAFTIPAVLKTILFSLFVFTIRYRS